MNRYPNGAGANHLVVVFLLGVLSETGTSGRSGARLAAPCWVMETSWSVGYPMELSTDSYWRR